MKLTTIDAKPPEKGCTLLQLVALTPGDAVILMWLANLLGDNPAANLHSLREIVRGHHDEDSE